MKRAISFLAVVALATVCAFGQDAPKALVAAAQKEGQLTVIALPHNRVNYGEMITTFSAKYGITVNELNPDGSSAEEIEAIKANQGNMGPQDPRRHRRRPEVRSRRQGLGTSGPL